MENENLKPIEKLTPFTKMIMTIGTLPSSFYSSMSYYESMVWLYEYLKNQVIPTVNNNAEAVEELQTAFTTLETFISEYFENLDVQQEINNKLDEMAEDGSLTALIKTYIDPLYQAYESSINEEIGLFKLNVENSINEQNGRITEVENELTGVASGAPLVASSTDDMTDTTRIYVIPSTGYWYYYDGDSWEIGGTYQASEDSETVDNLVNEVTDINTVLDMHKSYFNNDELSVGYYSLAANNVINTNNTNTGYKKIKLENLPAGEYRINKCRSVFTIIEDLTTLVNSRLSETDEMYSGIVTLEHKSNLYITTSSDEDECMLVSSGDLIPDYVDSKGAYSYELEKLKEGKVIHVEKDGSGDFTTLKEAIEYGVKYSNSKVYVGNGTYDLIEEFGPTYFENLGSVGKSGIKLSNNIHLIFSSNSKVTCNYTGNNNNVKIYFSPFNLLDHASGFTLENLKLECSNVRYAIHDEANGFSDPYKNVYKNCRIKIDNSNNTVWNPRQCIGGGLGTGEIIIDGCYFESTPRAGNQEDIVSYHNGNGNNIQSNILIKNSYFANHDGCRCSYYGSQTTMSYMTVTNCNLGRDARIIQESPSYSVVNIELIKWNNIIRE